MTDSEMPSVVVERRSEKHTVEIRLRVSGYPDIDDRDAIQTRSSVIKPEVVVIDYVRSSAGWAHGAVTVRVYGHQPGRILNGWADYRQTPAAGWCPAWLMDLVTRHLPAELDESGA